MFIRGDYACTATSREKKNPYSVLRKFELSVELLLFRGEESLRKLLINLGQTFISLSLYGHALLRRRNDTTHFLHGGASIPTGQYTAVAYTKSSVHVLHTH